MRKKFNIDVVIFLKIIVTKFGVKKPSVLPQLTKTILQYIKKN